jgi:fatty-acid desaturase
MQWKLTYFTGYIGAILGLVYTVQADIWPLYVASIIYWLLFCRLICQLIGLHKYWTHRSFSTGPIRHFILAFGSILCGTGSPYTWAVHHRHHHKHADTEKDVHSPTQNGWLSTILGYWVLNPTEWWYDKGIQVTHRDLVKDKQVMHVHKHYWKYWYALLVITTLIDWRIALLFVIQPIGLSLFVHGCNNLFSHTTKFPKSYRNYDLPDNSRNLPIWTNLMLLGEGYHNNHHNKPWAYDNADKPGEWDFSALVIKYVFDIHRGKRGYEYNKI